MPEYQLQIKQVVDYPRCRIYREFIHKLINDRSIRINGGSGLFHFTVLCSYANFRTSYRRIDGISYTVSPGEWVCTVKELSCWFRTRFHRQALSMLDTLQKQHLISYTLLGRGNVVKYKILHWARHNSALEYNAPCQKDTGFFFLPVSVALELVSSARCSEMDIVLDLWVSAVYNDTQVQGSEVGPVAYFRNGTGNPLVSYTELSCRWGLSRAIGFLKVGQKIDSFLSSLGVNVGHTGGSMLAEAMIAARGIGGIKNFSSHHFGGGRNSSSTNVNTNGGKGSGGFGAGFASGGLAGVVSRKVTNSAIKTATTTPGSKPSGLGSLLGDAAAGGIGGHMYASSVSKGGNFANNVIGSVATGSISQMGSISGEKAAEALHSYMGYAALESGAENVPTFQNIEIGGGRITGTELTAEHPEGISFGMYHADQYVAPEGQYTTVHAVDGTAWYKQYAVDAVDKSPYMAPDGSIAFNVSIVKKLPPAPRRKDKI
jgi:hypothetical protein